MQYLMLIHQGTEAGDPAAGLALAEAVAGLDGYHYLHAARAEPLRRLGRDSQAAAAYGRALDLAADPAERRLLERRRAELRWS